jgi:hypothetical protein
MLVADSQWRCTCQTCHPRGWQVRVCDVRVPDGVYLAGTACSHQLSWRIPWNWNGSCVQLPIIFRYKHTSHSSTIISSDTRSKFVETLFNFLTLFIQNANSAFRI